MVGFMGIGIGATRAKTLKRKDSDHDGHNLIDRFSHHFSDFSLSSSPARKIRRLDADLPPIMEEEEPDISPPPSFLFDSLADHNKAIVLFKPLKSPFFHASPSNISLSLHSNFISGFNADQLLRTSSNSSHHERPIEEDGCKECLAVVPWAPLPSHLIPPTTTTTTTASAEQPPELMDAEGDSMEIEDVNENKNNTTAPTKIELGQGCEGYEGLAQQWQQQHCMAPQPPHNTSTPITWFPVTQHHY